MVRRYLPLNPLRAFEAAARHLSFTRAAIELNVTHAAVSQQVRALEEQLGCVLFTRVSRGLVLTHEGEGLLPVLNEAFDRIADTLECFSHGQFRERVKVGAEADAMVTVFGILNLTEDSFFDESRRLDPAGAVTAAIEMLRVGSDVVDVGPAASHPDARPVSPADEIRRIAPLLDALSDQMHRVSIDSFQPETQRYALKRGVGYLNDIQGFPDPALYPDIAEADCRLVVMHSAQRDGIATRTGHLRPEDALDEIVRFFEARVSALRRSGVAADRLILDPGMGFFLSPAPETSLHVLSNLQKLKSALGLPLLVSVSRKSFLGATVGLPVKDLGPASLAAELHAIGNGADYVRTHAPGDLRSAITFSETLAKFRSRDARDRGLDHA